MVYNRVVLIRELIWTPDRIEHIARHDVEPDEVEDVCFGRPFVQRAKAKGDNPTFYVLGQTSAGRHLFCVIVRFSRGKGFPVTARPMTAKEKRSYNRWKKS
jgi:uncharacterized DUF497 family protein